MMLCVHMLADYSIMERSGNSPNKYIVVRIGTSTPADKCKTYEDAYARAVWRQEEITSSTPPQKWVREYLLDVGEYRIVRTVCLSDGVLSWIYYVIDRQETKVGSSDTYPGAVRTALNLSKEVSTDVEED